MKPSEAQRFMMLLEGDDDDCWLWQGHIDKDGYAARFKLEDGRYPRAARAAFIMFVRELEEGETVDHTCHTNSDCVGGKCKHRMCVNPAHLEAVSSAVNVKRSKRCTKTVCVRGHDLIGENLYVTPDGRRNCKICRSMTSLEKRHADAA